jgi:hypothetical protein
MSETKTEIVHWTPKEEDEIRRRLKRIKEQSGNFMLSTKSREYKELEELMPDRTAPALNVKVRTMMSAVLQPQVKTEVKQPPHVVDDATSGVLREVYGTVSYDAFMQILNIKNQTVK